jgi:large subunit ribosomal protein L17
MRHGKEGKKFNRKTGERRSFLRNLVNDLFRNGKIQTTEARAKAIRLIAERCITIAKKQDLAARRLLLSRLHNATIVSRLMSDIGPKYATRAGGYLRITKMGKQRKRDGSHVSTIELV